MPALSFQARFAGAVERGEKRQTIRAFRRDGRDPKPGQTLYLYTGMRTKACRKLLEVRCRAVREIYFWEEPGFGIIGAFPEPFPRAVPPIDAHELDALARADGFEDAAELGEWFKKTHGLPFRGLLIEW